jgi:hypothetical protein
VVLCVNVIFLCKVLNVFCFISGGSIADRPDSELFVLDKAIPAPAQKRKNKKEIKPLR